MIKPEDIDLSSCSDNDLDVLEEKLRNERFERIIAPIVKAIAEEKKADEPPRIEE